MVRMQDIAERMGISTVTVSKALAGKDGVSEDLRASIKATALQMGYVRQRRETPTVVVSTVGIVLPERLRRPEHSFYWALYLHLTEQLKKQGYYGFLEIVEDAEEAAAAAPAFLLRGQVSGVIVLGLMAKPYLEMLARPGLPLVLMDFYCDGVPSVAVIPDSYLGGWQVTRHLLEKGHRAIGFVGDEARYNNAQDAYFGYCKALRGQGIAPRDEWLIPDREGAEFRDTFDLPARLPTAFFCNCDQSAYHFMQYLQRVGVRVPQDVSVAGFYDHIFARLLQPQLTSYHIDMQRMAGEAVAALLDRPAAADGLVVVSGHLVERDSVLDISGGEGEAACK